MKTLTVCFHSDEDANLLKKIIGSTTFSDEVETFEDQDAGEFSKEDIEEFDRRMAEYEQDQSKGKSIDEVKAILKINRGNL